MTKDDQELIARMDDWILRWPHSSRTWADVKARFLGLTQPIDMILFCPHCNTQHIDAPTTDRSSNGVLLERGWDNPPHRTHLCRLDRGGCGWMWRPSDHATNGVLRLASGHQLEMKAPQWEQMAAKRYQETHINPPFIERTEHEWREPPKRKR